MVKENTDAWSNEMIYLEDREDTSGYCSKCGHNREVGAVADECTGACLENENEPYNKELSF